MPEPFVYNHKREVERTQLNIRLTKTEMDLIDAEVERLELASRSDFVRMCMQEHFENK